LRYKEERKKAEKEAAKLEWNLFNWDNAVGKEDESEIETTIETEESIEE
jgi:hypothetical protein